MTIRVVVVEDSPTARALLIAILQTDPELSIVGEATNGMEAIQLAKQLKPDVMTVDIQMPGVSGFEAIRRIMSETPTPIVVVSASIGVHDVAASMEALRAGALTALPKPEGPDSPDFSERCKQLTSTVKAMSEVKVVRRWPARSRPLLLSATNARTPSLLAIGASTGGPAALYRIFSELPSDLAVPVLVVQHIAHGFLPGLVEWWRSGSRLRFGIAREHEKLEAGCVYVAPDGFHLELTESDRISLSSADPIDGHRPAATALFRSAARAHGNGVLALILTGMGRDGMVGLRDVRSYGGRIIAQDEESSVVFGMPGAAVKSGLADEVLALDEIAARIGALFQRPAIGDTP